MKKFALAAIAALSLSLSLGSAYAATTQGSNQDQTRQAPQSFVYTPSNG